MTRCYPLIHFRSEQNAVETSYSANACAFRQKNILTIQFHINDPLQEIDWPKKNRIERQDYLWENTCFEAFISTPNQSNYFELNLSPSLAWNLYRFTDYRTPNDMPPIRVAEPALLKFEINDRLITVDIDLNALKIADQEITLGLTAVIKTAESIDYLSIHHPKSEADFHDSMGWTIRLLPEGEIHESIF